MVKGDRNQFGLLIAVVFISGHLSSFLHAVYSRRKKEGRYFSRFEGFSYRLNVLDQGPPEPEGRRERASAACRQSPGTRGSMIISFSVSVLFSGIYRILLSLLLLMV